MNPFDFVKASGGGDSLMPILIFIIWIVISFFSNAKKKKKKLEQQRKTKRVPDVFSTQDLFPQNSESMTQNEEKRAPVYNEIRTQLESVLSGREGTDAPGVPQAEESSFSLETDEVEEQSYEAPAPVFSSRIQPLQTSRPLSSAGASTAYDIAIPPSESEGMASSAITDMFSNDQEEKSAAQLLIAREEVRKGFVWSEILASPLALRDRY